MARPSADVDELWIRFHEAVNMSSPELREFLGASQETLRDCEPEPGVDLPAVSRHVLGLLSKRRMDLTGDDEEIMRLVTDVVGRRLAEPPPGGVRNHRWRHTLMMLGHDPLIER